MMQPEQVLQQKQLQQWELTIVIQITAYLKINTRIIWTCSSK